LSASPRGATNRIVAAVATVCSNLGDFSANRAPRTFSRQRSYDQPNDKPQGEWV
jgi:hypothetical protein